MEAALAGAGKSSSSVLVGRKSALAYNLDGLGSARKKKLSIGYFLSFPHFLPLCTGLAVRFMSCAVRPSRPVVKERVSLAAGVYTGDWFQLGQFIHSALMEAFCRL